MSSLAEIASLNEFLNSGTGTRSSLSLSSESARRGMAGPGVVVVVVADALELVFWLPQATGAGCLAFFNA